MPKQPDNLVIRILRDIQQTLADHTRTLADHTQRFERLDRRLDEVNDGMITALGLAGHAHVRHDNLQKEIEDLKKRIKRLEAKR
jgi:phage shock protein A